MEERGNLDEWAELKREIFSPSEIIASEIRTTKIVNALLKVQARKKQIFKAIKYVANDYFVAMAEEKELVKSNSGCV